ncbi:ABC transporter substrate-binding protein [Lachnospiraceae bacterium NSJ-143]|nr:ABC transporter substrate-binding protein [Lachnospiraceae bacterium NSJ-143]
MKKFVSLLTAACIITTSIFVSGCSKSQNDAKELTEVRLNEVVHSVFYAPQYVAIKNGYFEDEGLKIDLSVGQGADKSMTALLSGSADIALLGTEAGIYVYNEGAEDYAMAFAQPNVFKIRKNRPILQAGFVFLFYISV